MREWLSFLHYNWGIWSSNPTTRCYYTCPFCFILS